MILFSNNITIIRKMSGSYPDGIWVEGKTEFISNLKCSIQPLNGRDLMYFSEGERNKVEYKVYFQTPQSLQLEDIIQYNNKEYKILKDNLWDESPFLTHTKIFMSRLGD